MNKKGEKSILLMPGMKLEPPTTFLIDIKMITSGYVEEFWEFFRIKWEI